MTHKVKWYYLSNKGNQIAVPIVQIEGSGGENVLSRPELPPCSFLRNVVPLTTVTFMFGISH